MSQGRKKNAFTEPAEDPTDLAKAARGSQAANEMAVISATISEQYGDGLPYDRARIVHEARFFQAQSAEAMLELGKRLIQLKENEPHGEFIEIVEQQLGMPARTAQKFMQASVKFLAPTAKAPTLALLGKSKLFELMDSGDDDIDALAAGGTLAGLDLDDMQAMSARELRQALKEARQTVAAKDRVIESKNKKLDKLHEEQEARRAAPLPEQEQIQLDELRNATLAAEGALQAMLAMVDQVMQAPATQAAEVAARHSLDYLVQRIVDGCNDRGIAVDLAERVSPVWVGPIADAVASHATGRSSKKAR